MPSFDQEREIVLAEQGQKPRRIRSDFLPHAGVEAVVDVRHHQIQVRFGFADRLELFDPFSLLPPCKARAEIQKFRQFRRSFRIIS